VIARRTFLACTGAVFLAVPLAAEAQQAGKVYRIGILCAHACDSVGRTQESSRPMSEFQEALRMAGYVDGKNIRIDFRGAGVADNRLDAAAARLVAEKVDVIVAAGASTAVSAARRATQSTPIVMAVSDDADQEALMGSLSRPSGNVTGISVPLAELVTKQVQLLTETVHGLSSLTILFNPRNPGHRRAMPMAQRAAQSLGQQVNLVSVESQLAFESAFTEIRKTRPGALLILPDPMFEGGDVTLFALRNRLPSIFTFGGAVLTAGGLMAYGPNLSDLHRRAALYVEKILKGTKPSALPIEQPTNYRLIINVQTAKALGLTIPQSLLQRADEIIQ
jgi:putative ABC transport system substrate-binding protein